LEIYFKKNLHIALIYECQSLDIDYKLFNVFYIENFEV